MKIAVNRKKVRLKHFKERYGKLPAYDKELKMVTTNLIAFYNILEDEYMQERMTLDEIKNVSHAEMKELASDYNFILSYKVQRGEKIV